MDELRGAITPAVLVEQFAAAGIEISERTLRAKIREIGAYRIIGRVMFLMPDDVATIMEASKPQPKTRDRAPSNQATIERWTDADLEKLMERVEKGAKTKRGEHAPTPKRKRSPQSKIERWTEADTDNLPERLRKPNAAKRTRNPNGSKPSRPNDD